MLTDFRLWSWVLGMSVASLTVVLITGDTLPMREFIVYGTGASLITVQAMRVR